MLAVGIIALVRFLEWLGEAVVDVVMFGLEYMPVHIVLAGLAFLVMLVGGVMLVLG